MKTLYASKVERITKKSFYSQNVMRWQQSANCPDFEAPKDLAGKVEGCSAMNTFCIEQGKPVRIWR
jgi:hypothetical protein